MSPDRLTAAIEALGPKTTGLHPVMGFPRGPFWKTTVPGAEAFRCWQVLRDRVNATGYWPVVVGGSPGPGTEYAEGRLESWAENWSAPEIVAGEEVPAREPEARLGDLFTAADPLFFERWGSEVNDPQRRVEKYLRDAEKAERRGQAEYARFLRNQAESWKNAPPKRPMDPDDVQLPPAVIDNPPQQELSCIQWFDPDTFESKVADEVVMLFVRAGHTWEVPAHLLYTTKEGERTPDIHVAALKWLSDRHGAELVGIDDRVLEVVPRRRPRNKTEAVTSAAILGTYASCPITSENERASLEDWAWYLMQSKLWSFCWP
jgi:hypothetical protein